MNNNNRISINCPTCTTPEKKPLQIGQIGYTRNNNPAIYNYCRGHREFHAKKLAEILRTMRQMGNGDIARMRAYIDTLNKALLEAQADMQTMTDAIIIAEKQEGA